MSTMHKHDEAPLSVQQIIDAIVGCEASVDELSEMIAAALADARREGAEQMRDAAAKLARKEPLYYSSGEPAEEELAQAIEDLPLPDGERQAVLLEDWQLAAAMSEIQPGDELAAGFSFLSWQSGRPDAASALDEARLVQAAVLSANGLEVRRG
jgi:hypothetical protein